MHPFSPGPRRIALAAFTVALVLGAPARALNPAVGLRDYNHAAWTSRDGAPAEIKTMAQTPDGWLWLGTSTGLFRFDGVTFERYEIPTRGEVAKRRVTELRATASGDLWMVFSVGGLSVLRKDGRFEDIIALDTPMGGVISIAPEADGHTWLSTTRGLYVHAGGKLHKIGPAQGAPDGPSNDAQLDQYGQLWVLFPAGLYRLDRQRQQFTLVLPHHGNGTLLQSPDGRLWIADERQVTPVAAELTQPAGLARPLPAPAQLYAHDSRNYGLFDRDGNLWARACPDDPCIVDHAGSRGKEPLRLPQEASHSLPSQALTSRASNVVLEDMEGNIWVGTQSGLDRFRENHLIRVPLPHAGGLYSMGGDTEGALWLADSANQMTWQLSPTAPPRRSPRYFRVVGNDRAGGLLLAGARSIERHYRGAVSQIPMPPAPDGKPVDHTVLGLVDDGKVLWMASPQAGLMGYIDGAWQPRSAFSLPPRIFLGIGGPQPGQRWHATGDGTVVFNDNGKLTTYDASAIGLATMLYNDDRLVAAGDLGLAIFDGHGLRKLSINRPEVLNNISGMAVSGNGDRWFNGGKGVVHVRRADWLATLANPDLPLRYQLLGELDGYVGQAMLENRLPSVYADRDNRLWFMTSAGVLRLSPGEIRQNPVAPVPQILSVQLAGASRRAVGGLRLPPGAQNFDIRYTAPGLGKPEAMRFQYQLSGVNDGWQDAGGRRIAYYTNVAPGHYTFRVRAFNEDGLAGKEEARLDFDIEPTFVQTVWFKALCGVALGAVLYLLYLYRLRVATRRVAAQLLVRMAERERIARTLHDTFLQSVQALILRLDVVSRHLPDDARRQLGPILDCANDTIVEGRDQVHALRTGRVDDIESAAEEAGRRLADENPATAFAIATSGTRRRLADLVAEEACEIVREALRNAYRHAGATHVAVLVGYGKEQFVLQIDDDGSGMTPEAAAKDRHYGLIGMRERAARAGGRLDLGTAPAGGVRVTLTVPARSAYVGARRWWQRRQA